MPTADWRRIVALVLVGALAAGGACFLFGTAAGRAARAHPRRAAADVRRTVADHPVATPTAFVAVYVALAVVCFPVWWLQVFAGVAFGLWAGGGLCLTGSAIAATVTAALADWFAGEWFHTRIESRMARLKWLDETLGSNGLLVVMTVRLTHVVPFGLSNVALGLSRVSAWTVGVGTLVGNIPAVAIYVGIGAGYRPRANWRFAAVVAGVNVLLLAPLWVRLLVRFLRNRRGRGPEIRIMPAEPPTRTGAKDGPRPP